MDQQQVNHLQCPDKMPPTVEFVFFLNFLLMLFQFVCTYRNSKLLKEIECAFNQFIQKPPGETKEMEDVVHFRSAGSIDRENEVGMMTCNSELPRPDSI